MAVFTSMDDPMDQEKKDMMEKQHELLADMLDLAIQELESVVEETDYCLLDHMKECK